jgi:hypothetical protein
MKNHGYFIQIKHGKDLWAVSDLDFKDPSAVRNMQVYA